MIKNENGIEFSQSDQINDLEFMKNVTMADFDQSFNTFIGITDTEFKWFDNPYISANVYEFD